MIETNSGGREGIRSNWEGKGDYWFGRQNRYYRTKIRRKNYENHLVERSFCLDVNFLSSQGFFRLQERPGARVGVCVLIS